MKNKGFFRFGKIIPGLVINGKSAPYPVLNERAIRAGSGIMFVLALFALTNAFFIGNYFPLKGISLFFFFDFFIKIFLGTRFSLVSILANFIVQKQKPEYVGAIQKRFAWSIGLLFSASMIILLFVFQETGTIVFLVCMICLIVMWFETSFGICVGCKMYSFLVKKGALQEEEFPPACPGGSCSLAK